MDEEGSSLSEHDSIMDNDDLKLYWLYFLKNYQAKSNAYMLEIDEMLAFEII